METPDFELGIIYFEQFSAERVKTIMKLSFIEIFLDVLKDV